jgi:hypothetical protein
VKVASMPWLPPHSPPHRSLRRAVTERSRRPNFDTSWPVSCSRSPPGSRISQPDSRYAVRGHFMAVERERLPRKLGVGVLPAPHGRRTHETSEFLTVNAAASIVGSRSRPGPSCPPRVAPTSLLPVGFNSGSFPYAACRTVRKIESTTQQCNL